MSLKTNAIRMLEDKNIWYEEHVYDSSIVNGEEVANELGENAKCVFKTLVTVAPSRKNYVFVVPVNKTLDLKKAAKAVDEKSVSMIKQKELLPLTGYIHGGCSPFGMKKFFTTVIDSSAKNLDIIFVSAGKVGRQIEMRVEDIQKVIDVKFEDIVKE